MLLIPVPACTIPVLYGKARRRADGTGNFFFVQAHEPALLAETETPCAERESFIPLIFYCTLLGNLAVTLCVIVWLFIRTEISELISHFLFSSSSPKSKRKEERKHKKQ